MKFTIVGGGSTYSPELVDGLGARATSLGIQELVLNDIDQERLEVVGGFVTRMLAAQAPSVRVVLTQDLEAAVDDAAFVLTQIRVGGQRAREQDERCGAASGLIGQETTGVGGFRKAMRTIPELLKIARVIEKRAPAATLINFTNPVSIVTQAVLCHSHVRAIGLCNIPISLRMDLAKLLEVPAESVRLDSVGLNHLSFVRRVLVDGKDVLPELIDRVSGDRERRPANIPELDYPDGFLTALGMIPSDYLKYFFLEEQMLREQSASKLTRAEEVMAIEDELLAYYADKSNVEKPESLSKRGGAFYSRAALEVIDAIAEDRGDELVVDVKNQGAVAELASDAVVEVPCRVSRQGEVPLPQKPLPPEIRGLIQHVKAYEDLTVQAAVEKSRRLALLALTTNPLVRSAEVAGSVLETLGPELGLN